MKALLCNAFGPIEDLTVAETPAPVPDDDQVLVDVRCASLNFPDALMVQGRYQIKPPTPFSPGMDLAGVVHQIGKNVTHVSVGERVIAFPGHGAFAEMCVAPKEKVIQLPEGMPFATGAAFGLTYSTAIHAFADCGRLLKDESVLVLGAAGGVGLAAIEVAKAMGARVIAAASDPEKLAVCRSTGADETIDYSKEDLRKRTLALTGGKGVNVVCDPVGGAYTQDALRATAWGGRLLVIGFAAGEIPKIPLNLALLSERAIIGVYWGSWSALYPAKHQRNMAQLAQWFAEGKIKPLISDMISLSGVPEAMRRLMARQVKGKVVIQVQDH
ncbi:MAG: NADPH:quinone oxidoreductase [Desulfatitalea sp. BRH_c12]|nr:MAG: NADPH:quinone oxidoreductase [Desulfatitalea sp. BRH_c12]